MLVLTRKQQEKIRIGNDITITVLRTKGNAVRLGIEAPSNIAVIRGELQFEREPKIAVTSQDDAGKLPAPKPDIAHATAAARRTGTEWASTSEPNGSAGRLPGVVTHQRVQRDHAAPGFPGVAEGESPLKALMKRRSLSA